MMEIKIGGENKELSCDDQMLWEAFLDGDNSALSEIFVRHYEGLFHYGMHLVGHQEDVKDGIQQLFAKLCQKRDALEQAHSVEFYLLFSLRRILFRTKKQKRSRQDKHQEYAQDFTQPAATIEEELIREEQKRDRRETLKAAFKSLTKRQREIFILRLQHGLTNKEIAQLADITHKTVRNCIYEATKRLKGYI